MRLVTNDAFSISMRYFFSIFFSVLKLEMIIFLDSGRHEDELVSEAGNMLEWRHLSQNAARK